MREEIINIRTQVLSQIMRAKSQHELEEIRVAYLGRKGKFNLLVKKIKDLDSSKRTEIGILLNESKNVILKELAARSNKLKQQETKWFDPTIPGIKPGVGRLHVITKAIAEIALIFEKLGFVRARYPEVEWDWQAFGSLNFPENHPARDEWETFFINTPAHPKYGPMLLTPHTSSGQIREMERVSTPPIRMINIGKCYRRQSDVSHFPMFHQFEGLVIDKNIAITHLKGTLDYFAKSYLGATRQTRIRPYNFLFTEPSFEVDVSCGVCDGKGHLVNGKTCKLCKQGWLELGGAGMVHPMVLKNGGIDPTIYSGFAFGWGVERAYMMRGNAQIPDIRILYSTDLATLSYF